MFKMKTDRKPPLAKSPARLRSNRVLRSKNTLTPPGSLAKPQKVSLTWDMEELKPPPPPPEYRSISCELRALAKMVQDEFGDGEIRNREFGVSLSTNSTPMFERGRFYEEYSARRNERLKRKKGQIVDEGKMTPYKLGVTSQSAKRSSAKKVGILKKSISAAYSVERTSETPRYMLRSMTKDNIKKPPLPGYSGKSKFGGEPKSISRKVRII